MNYNKTILVTGGCGFIGSNYLNKFVSQYPNYRFVNIDAITYAANPKNITVGKAPNYAFKKTDIRDKKALEKVFKKYSPTDIIHFAAESHVDISIENPSIFVETNIGGTHNLLLLAKKYGIKRFYQISTDEVYGSLHKDAPAFTTSSPLAPNSPYSASKAAADILVRSYHKTFGLDAVISRCSNNYGPNQDVTKLIPKAISHLKSGKKIPLYGTGENIRDWIFVDDHIDAIDLIFHKGVTGEIYNIGGDCEMSNTDIVHEIIHSIASGNKKTEEIIEYVADRPGHDFRYAIDTQELAQKLGWKPKTSFKDGLRKTIDAHR